MSNWAEIKEVDGKLIVHRVLVGDNNSPDEGEAFMNSLGGRWVKTSFNGNIRKNFAGPGMEYREDIDAFIPLQPFPSWTLDEDAKWQPPIARPNNGVMLVWNESTLNWEEPVNG